MSDTNDLVLSTFGGSQARAATVSNIDQSPDEAARAIQLSDATGTPAPVIAGDLSTFERNHKAALASGIVHNNSFISDYVTKNSMASRVSNDDYGNLDAVSQTVQRGWTNPQKSFWQTNAAVTGTVLEKGIQAFKEGFGSEGLGSWLPTEDITNHRFLSALASGLGAPAEVVLRALGGTIDAAKAAAAGGAEEFGKQIGMDPSDAQRLGREAGGTVEMYTTMPMHMAPHLTPEVVAKARETMQAAKPWVEAGKEPPLGVHPLIDQVKVAQSEMDLMTLAQAQKEAQASLTKERAPALFEDFIGSHTDAKIGVSPDAVRKLYGDKVPAVDDNLFGFVSDLANKLRIAEASGQDIQVPLAEWLTKVDPDVAKELQDDVRVRPGGVTKNEAKEIEPAKADEALEQPVAEPIESVRNLAGIKTLYDTGERKLELKREESTMQYAAEGSKFHDFSLVDENGEPSAYLNLSEMADGKRLYVEDIRGTGKLGPRDFGPSLMRSVLQQLKTEFPNAETLEGFRVSGARDKAGTYESHGKVSIKLDEDLDPQLMKINEAGWIQVPKIGAQFKLKPTELYTAKDKEIVKAVNEEIDRLVPSGLRAQEFEGIRSSQHTNPQGMYLHGGIEPMVAWSLDSKYPVKTARHEVIHHLYREGFFSEGEWKTLENSALEGGWVEKHSIDRRYPTADQATKVEESIAEEFAKWRGDQSYKASPEVKTVFEKLKALLDSIAQRIKEIFGRDVDHKELFEAIESGDIGSREPVGETQEGMAAQEGEQPGMADRDAFEHARDIGITEEEAKLFKRLIEKRNEEDFAKAEKRATEEVKRRQTETWKDNSVTERAEAAKEVNSRPVVIANDILRGGDWKLGSKFLSEEQRKTLPKDYLAKDGINPDDIAHALGYHTGEAMVNDLGKFEADVKASGLRAMDYKRQLISAETERRMEAKYGKLADNILDEAKEQAFSETQLQLLHEETLRTAMKAGLEFSIDGDAFRKQVREDFKSHAVEDVSSDQSAANAGKAMRLAIRAGLKGDWQEAFRQMQRHYISSIEASEARLLEHTQEDVGKIAKRYRTADVNARTPEYTNFIQDILTRVGAPIKRSIQDLAESQERDGFHSLADFVRTKEDQLRELHVPEWLQDPKFQKETGKLTVGEFEELSDALKAMDFNSRDELKVYKAGESADLNEVLDGMKERIQSLGPPKDYPVDRSTITQSAKDFTKSRWWGLINIESMMNRLDRGDPKGLFNQYIVRPITEASNYKDRLIRDYQSKISEVGKIEDMDKLVENSLFVDPITGQAFTFRKRNVLGILQNAGNASNLKKLAGGYGLKPEQVMQWLHERTTKDDWDRAQKIGDIFAELYEKASVMSHNISGVGLQKLALTPFDTPHGKYEGWYNPIKYDQVRPGKSVALLGKSIEEEGYFRATTPQGYTKERSGYIAPVELNLDIVPQRMKQMINDIAMRPAVVQASKFFYNPAFEREMTARYGLHQAKEMIPYLRDIANVANFKSLQESWGLQASEFFRQNVVTTLVGFNPGTVMKHGTTALVNSAFQVGGKAFLSEMVGMLGDSGTGKSNWGMALEKSEELQRRMRNFSEIIAGHGSEINLRGAKSKFQTYRDFMMSAGATPVAISDMLSSVPTWLAKYKDGVAQGLDEGQAVFEADRAVRQTHGSSAITNKPSMARSNNALGPWFTSLYSFFSHMLQKQYEMAWMAKDSFTDVKGGDLSTLKEHAPNILKGFFSYILIPALVEELVTPYTNSEKDSWGMKAAKGLGMGISSSLTGIRDAVRAVIDARDPQIGLMGTATKSVTDLARDLQRPDRISKERAGVLIKDAVTIGGVLTGLTNASEGKALEYAQRYAAGLEKPKGAWDVATGLRFGKTDKHSRTVDEWLKNLKGH